MSKFHNIKVSEIKRETSDSISIAFEIPDAIKKEFQYKQGQYITFVLNLNGEELRRSYSLCSSPYLNEPLRVAVKQVDKGKVSTFMNQSLQVGQELKCMTPTGNFFTELKSDHQKHYVAFAAGSGITPIFSIIKSVLSQEPKSKFTLVYSNKTKASSIFREELETLAKDHSNFEFIPLYSQENTGDPLLHGRINEERLAQIVDRFNLLNADDYFLCGPEDLIRLCNDYFVHQGIKKEKIHYELFTTPVHVPLENKKVASESFSGKSAVTVIIDGIETTFDLDASAQSILDAAMDAGADAPFSCKGAVCCTCKAKVIEGKASMDMNYSLTDKEVDEGFILTCQAHPLTEQVKIDYDVF